MTLDEKLEAEAERLRSHYVFQIEGFIQREFGKVGLKTCDFAKVESLVEEFISISLKKGKEITIYHRAFEAMKESA